MSTVETNEKVEKVEHDFSIAGYTLIGPLGVDGIKYYWQKNDNIVESLAFNKRLKNNPSSEDIEISAYTISSSFGCPLAATQKECLFCDTGKSGFHGFLSADDIALQSIFMAEYDSDCPSYPSIRKNAREFAFMGQGEPGYNYPAIRQAIIMTDYVMMRLDQRISRYIISTSGVFDFIPILLNDIKTKIFQNRVSIHFSLNAIDEDRSDIMPINNIYNFKDMIGYCKALYSVTKEKIGVSILMFDNCQLKNGINYTLTRDKLERILAVLDNDIFRIDLCALNETSVTRHNHQLSNAMANELLEVVKQKGFEGKIFTSFGDTQKSGLGMLSSNKEDLQEPGNTTIHHFNRAVALLADAKKNFLKNF